MLDAETGAITDVNPFLIKMLGYTREEFVEKKLWEVGVFKDVEASQDAFEALQKNEYIRYEDLPLKSKSGKLIDVEFVSNVYLVDWRTSDPMQHPRYHRPQTGRGRPAPEPDAAARAVGA